jgi:hypothetical protein
MRLSWARLLKRVFELDLEHCPNCGGELKIIAAFLEQPVIEKILTHLVCRPGRLHGRQRVGRLCNRPDDQGSPLGDRHDRRISAGPSTLNWPLPTPSAVSSLPSVVPGGATGEKKDV